ncbi:hypothetical protein KSF78_0009073 [Schistosoma japonicum]|nr:hypothetical protein KSF78_0009073 [Schistosoma japonicum]
MNSYWGKFNMTVDKFTDCERRNIRGLRGQVFIKMALEFLESNVVKNTKYYNDTIKGWNECLTTLDNKFQELLKHNGLLYCRNLVKGSPSNINGIGTIARKLETEILSFNGYHMMVYVLKEILKEMEYSGTTVK